MAKTQMLICPYCGEAQPLAERCRVCRGFFEPLSRQATHNSMGPWYIRDTKRPHRPGCSYETLVRLVERGQIDRFSIIRGPTTRQFWAVAKRVPGVSHLLGYCHNCDAHVEATAHGCPKCGVPFGAFLNRNHLGLPDIRPLPWEAELDLSDRKRLSGNGNGEASGHAGAAPKRNVGISSFATDEELTSAAPVGRPAAARSSPAASVAGDEPEFVDVPGEEPGLADETKASSPGAAAGAPALPGQRADSDRTARTLRATVMQQRRTIRLLTVAVVAIALLSAAFSFVLIRMLSTDDGAQRPGQTGVRETSGGLLENASPTGAGSPTANGASQPEPKRDSVPPAPVEENPADAEPMPPAEHAAALAGIEEARVLLEAARDESRSLDDRIADCDRAVQLLEAAAEDVPADALPADFAETLKRARTDLERLRLSKFFP